MGEAGSAAAGDGLIICGWNGLIVCGWNGLIICGWKLAGGLKGPSCEATAQGRAGLGWGEVVGRGQGLGKTEDLECGVARSQHFRVVLQGKQGGRVGVAACLRHNSRRVRLWS